MVWLFNFAGSLDMIAAIAFATFHDAAPFMGPAYWIPAFSVPAILVTHYVTFRVLWTVVATERRPMRIDLIR